MPEPILVLDNVTKNFGGLTAVNEVSFQVRPKEIMGLIGPNGAGKTTLFNVISGYYAPSRGKVLFQGKDISGKTPYALAGRGIGRTFQVVKPFPGLSVLENVIIASFLRHPKRARAEEHARKILEFTELTDRAHQSAASLTLAGRKRLEIGKALALEPTFLLLDEVVAGLNPDRGRSHDRADPQAPGARDHHPDRRAHHARHHADQRPPGGLEFRARRSPRARRRRSRNDPGVMEAYLGGAAA